MCTKKTAGTIQLLVLLIGLSVCWMSCNESSTGDGTTAITEGGHAATFEMKPPGSIIPKDSAAKMVKAYRAAGGGPFSTQIVLHHPDAVKFYMDSIFYKYTPKVELPKGYVWRVAFSPMFYLNGADGPKLSFCLVPCIVNTSVSPAAVYEFFTEMEKNSEYYTQYYLPLYNSIGAVTMKRSDSDSTGGFVFDEGQLWP